MRMALKLLVLTVAAAAPLISSSSYGDGFCGALPNSCTGTWGASSHPPVEGYCCSAVTNGTKHCPAGQASSVTESSYCGRLAPIVNGACGQTMLNNCGGSEAITGCSSSWCTGG